MERKLVFSCPVCGRETDYLLSELKEGAVLNCPFCKLSLTLQDHMWEYVQKEIKELKKKKLLRQG
jgi:transcription elongation factor Elf1